MVVKIGHYNSKMWCFEQQHIGYWKCIIEPQTLGLFCVTCQMFKLNPLLIIHPFWGWYHIAKLYWKGFIGFWPLVSSIRGFISIVSWKCVCAHIILHRFTRILLFFCNHKDNLYNGPMLGNCIAYRYQKTCYHIYTINLSKPYSHFKKSWSTWVYTCRISVNGNSG